MDVSSDTQRASLARSMITSGFNLLLHISGTHAELFHSDTLLKPAGCAGMGAEWLPLSVNIMEEVLAFSLRGLV